jgi:putative flippase GtrA
MSRMNELFRQFSTFAGVGLIATCLHYAVLVGIVELAGISALAGSLMGYSAGGLLSYVLNRSHTFRSDRPHEETAWRFALIVFVGFALTYLCMRFLVENAGVPYLPAQIATTAAVMLWNFGAHKAWTFA